jgi:methylated-DNA-[protein]-cysteine S-methyltransferase
MINTPLGPLRAVFDEEGLTVLSFSGGRDDAQNALYKVLQKELDEYFAGERRTFDIPLHPRGTAFQQKIWAELLKIPYGGTRSYGELAGVRHARAAGGACHANPVVILIPCHRVVGSDGKLTGYAGGVEKKQFLLSLEKE